MNALDRMISWIHPEAAVKREHARRKLEYIQASGYGNYGANKSKKALKGWIAGGGSAQEDIHDHLGTLRERSRDLYAGVPLANGAIKTYQTNVIGSGLTPKPTIDYEAVGLTEEQASELEKQVAREFYLWADGVDCDAERLSSFYELQGLAFLNWLMSGDVFAVLQMKERVGSQYELCIRLVEADRVCTPGTTAGMEFELDGKIVSGVETDDDGEVVAYHIAKRHPLSYRSTEKQEWTRVEVFGHETGRRNILHVMTRERIGQRRGVPMLAPVIEALKQLGRYTDAELIAAVVNGYVALFIEKDIATPEVPLGEGTEPEEALVDSGDQNSIEWGPGSIADLGPGEHAKVTDPGRPNANFDGFVTAICKQIGAALGLPYELLVKQFTASYSASRAALLEAWKSFTMWRDWMAEKFCQPIYEAWFDEAVALGRISAPGYFSDPAIRKAYTAAQWYGPTQGQLDPVKEVEAAELRVQYGFSTRAKEAMELTGTDYQDNIRIAKTENKMLKEAMGDGEIPIERNGNQ